MKRIFLFVIFTIINVNFANATEVGDSLDHLVIENPTLDGLNFCSHSQGDLAATHEAAFICSIKGYPFSKVERIKRNASGENGVCTKIYFIGNKTFGSNQASSGFNISQSVSTFNVEKVRCSKLN